MLTSTSIGQKNYTVSIPKLTIQITRQRAVGTQRLTTLFLFLNRRNSDLVFDGLNEGGRGLSAVDFALDKFAEVLFLAEDLKVGGVGLYFV